MRSASDIFPDLLREQVEDTVIDKSAERVAQSIVTAILSTRHEYADKLSEESMIRLATDTIAPILQSWKDN